MVLPAFMLGIGRIGALTLADLAEQIGHAYGQDAMQAVSLLSVGIGETPPAPTIPYYDLYTDASDWLAQPERASAPDMIHGWLDPTGLTRQRLTADWLMDRNNRQLVRLMFLKHLTYAYQPLVRFMQQHTTRVLQYGRVSDANIYLLTSLDELVGSALLLDLATVLRHALRGVTGQHMRLITYIALPVHAETDDQLRTAANAFAALRELEQSCLTSHVFPLAVLPSTITLDARCPVDYIRLYGERPAQDDPHADQHLIAQWSDALLAQIDQRFGARFIQENWINLEAVKDTVGLEDELLVGTQRTAAAVFPHTLAQNVWSARLAHEALAQHLHLTMPAQRWRDELRRWGVEQTGIRSDHDHLVYSPRVLSHLLKLETSASVIRRLNEADPIQFAQWICGLDDMYADQIREIAHLASAKLYWKPNANDALKFLGSGAACRFCEHIEKQLTSLFGPLEAAVNDIDSPEVTHGDYYMTLHRAANGQRVRFNNSLVALIQHLLTGVGITHTLAALSHLTQELEQVQRALEEARQQQTPIHARLSQLRLYSGTLVQLTNRLMPVTPVRPTRETQHYVALANDITVMLKRQIGLRILTQMVTDWVDALHDVMPRLEAMQHIVCADDRALYQQMADRKDQFDERVTRHDGRYWLFDEKWAATFYASRIQPYVSELAEQLVWHVRKPDDGAFESLAAVQFELTLLHLPLLPPAHDYDYEENAQRFWREAERFVISLTDGLSLWDYVLSGLGRHTRAIGDTLRRVDSLLTGTYPDKVSRTHFLLEPDKSRASSRQNEMIENLLVQIETTELANFERASTGSRAHILAFANTEVIPMRATHGYQRVQAAYMGLRARDRQQMYVFPREAAAAELEVAMKRAGLLAGENQWLAPSTVVLLAYRERLEWLAWVEALEWLRKIEYTDGHRNSYALILPATADYIADTVWLGQPAAVPDYYYAVYDFCLADGWLTENTYGEGSLSVAALMIQARVDTYIDDTLESWFDPNQKPSPGEYWQWAISVYQREGQPWALRQARRAELMQQLYTRCLARAEHAGDHERELMLLLAHTAQTLFENYNTAIRKRLVY
ncbi:MAG: hypothetical protein JXA10_09880 [Anaerolineae bacterium]|nr:hypothetical protein [Anaerolineae bacterium]